MIDVYYWTTPNGHKITIFLEETGLSYAVKPVNIGKGDQFKPEFLKISPNNRIPAIVDHEPGDGGRVVLDPPAALDHERSAGQGQAIGVVGHVAVDVVEEPRPRPGHGLLHDHEEAVAAERLLPGQRLDEIGVVEGQDVGREVDRIVERGGDLLEVDPRRHRVRCRLPSAVVDHGGRIYAVVAG